MINIIYLDVETDGLHFSDPLVSIAFSTKDRSISFGINHPEATMTEKEAIDKIQRIVNKSSVIINHNIKFDLTFLLHNGIEFKHKPLLIDTQIMAWLASGQRNKQVSLEELSSNLLGTGKVEGLDFKKKKASEYPLKELLYYNEVDTQLPLKIYDKLVKDVGINLLKFYSDMIYAMAKIEMNGLYLDHGELQAMHENVTETLSSDENELMDMLEYPINISSTQQLSCALFGGEFKITGGDTELVQKTLKSGKVKEYTRKCDKYVTLKGLGFGTSKLKRNANGYWPTSADVIVKLKGKTKKAKRYVELYKEYNKLKTLYDKFLKPYMLYINNNYIYTNYNLCSTYTGRTSSTQPNV